MSTTTERELGYALGMVERRVNLAATIGKSSTQNEAISVHRSVCGAVKEVRKHHKNILGSIDNEGAGHAMQCQALLATVEKWRDMSRSSLEGWGVSDADIESIEEAVGL